MQRGAGAASNPCAQARPVRTTCLVAVPPRRARWTVPEWPERVRLAGDARDAGRVPFRSSHGQLRIRPAATGFVAPSRIWPASHPPASGEGPRYGGGRQVTVAGLIDEQRKRNGRTSFVLDDGTARIEVTLFEEAGEPVPRPAGKGRRDTARRQPAFRRFQQCLAHCGASASRCWTRCAKSRRDDWCWPLAPMPARMHPASFLNRLQVGIACLGSRALRSAGALPG